MSVLLLASASVAPEQEVIHQDCSFEIDGLGIESFFQDLDGDGRAELITTLLAIKSGRREIHVRSLDKQSRYPLQAQRVVEVLPDVVTWAIADVRAEPGLEFVFLTRSGAFSFSLTKDGYQGNIQRMLQADMLFDVPDPKTLPRWRYVVEGTGGDFLLLPLHDGFSVWKPNPSSAEQGALDYLLDQTLPAPEISNGTTERDQRNRKGSRGIRIGVNAGNNSPLLPEEAPTGGALLNVNVGYSAPALADVDGDGIRDMLFMDEQELRVHAIGKAPVDGRQPLTQDLPGYMRMADDKVNVDATLVDADADGDVDLIVQIAIDGDGLSNRTVDLLLLRNQGGRLFPDRPDQVLRFEAAELRFNVVDVDGDGRPDLNVRKFEMPSMVEAATGLEFRSSTLVYFGIGKGPRGPAFERKPTVKEERTFDAESLGLAIGRRRMQLDVSGDGVADEVEIDLDGRIEVRRLQKESSFFGGDTWALEKDPWRRFDVFGDISDLTIADVNGDGIADLLSSGSDSVAVLISRPGSK